jgi:hydrogenase assembly chaperone HypC/HupF
MCMAIPGVLRRRWGGAGEIEIEGAAHTVDLTFLPEADVGDWVLVGLGAGLRVLSEPEAFEIRAALRELSQIEPATGMPVSTPSAATPADSTEAHSD